MRSPSEISTWARTPTGRKAVRYSAVSAISILVTELVFFLTYGVFRVGSGVECNFIATAAATVPAYYLNRNWAWGKTGASHLWREVVPFWIVAFLGLLFSLAAVWAAERAIRGVGLTHLAESVVLDLTLLGAYGALWIAKFVLFNKLLFADKSQQPKTFEPESHAWIDAGPSEGKL